MAAIGLDDFGAALAGLGAISTASFGLLDSSKAFWGGVSNIGSGGLKQALAPFAPALQSAIGTDWWRTVRANWIAGVTKADQKAKVQALIKLGLTSATAGSVATAAHVDAAALIMAIGHLERGTALTEQDLNVIGRMDATIDALMDAAFEAADQQYRNICRVLAGLIAIGLAIAAKYMWQGGSPPSWPVTLLVGLLAVPLAPVAKDLTAALSTAMRALKAAQRI